MLNDKFKAASKFFANLAGCAELPIKLQDNFLAIITGLNGFLNQENNQPKEIVLVNFTPKDFFLEVLAHEYCHAKQFAEKRLQLIAENENNARVNWCGEDYLMTKSDNNEQYLNRPWEIEARHFQREWFVKFNRFWRENFIK